MCDTHSTVSSLNLDPSLSKPSITVRPKVRNHKGETVTLECEGPEDTVNFSLLKSKRLTALQEMKEKYKRANFSLPALRPEDAGRYACQYCHTTNPFVCSELSDPVRVTLIDNSMTTIIWASGAAGLLLALFLLMLVLLLCKKRKKRSTVNEGIQPMNRLLEQNAGTDHSDREDHDGVTYAVLSQHSVKIKKPPSQPTGPESCIYASVAK
uniref:Uncharacterized protein n=1 Tax=Sphaerodactylus townsendi TaxID=933632 RepID=A0ACB8EVT3_9SAUR